MDEIAERAGISKPMVYAYLGTKEDLFVACYTGRIRAAHDHAAEDVGEMPREQLRRGVRAFFRFVAATARPGPSCTGRPAREPFADEVAQSRARMVEVVAGLLRRPPGSGPGARAAGGAATPWSARVSRWRTGSPTTLTDRPVRVA